MLGELYKQALEAKGYTVKLKKNIGSTEIIDKALTSGQIDGYPEYLGVSVAVVAGKDIIPKSDQETYDLAKKFYEGRGQTISQQTPFFDVDAIATTKDFATKNSLKSVADLKKLDSFTVGARPEFKSRYQGLKGMQKVYGLTNAQFKQLALGIQYQALDKGDVDSANVFSTDAQLASGKYTVLEDPKGIFGYQHVAMVFDKKKNDALGPEFFATIDGVSKLLTNDAMISMNKAVATRQAAGGRGGQEVPAGQQPAVGRRSWARRRQPSGRHASRSAPPPPSRSWTAIRTRCTRGCGRRSRCRGCPRWTAGSSRAATSRFRRCGTPRRSRSTTPRFSTGQVVGPSMLTLDGAEHARHRGAVRAAVPARRGARAVHGCSSRRRPSG